MQEIITNLACDFGKFLKDNSLELAELEQANFIQATKNNLDIKKMARNLVSVEFINLYNVISFYDLDYYINIIQDSDFNLIGKKTTLFLLLNTISNRYILTLSNNLHDKEVKFIYSYIKKIKEFIEFCSNNEKDLALFLCDIKAYRKYLKNDEFLMPIKLQNTFNWIKKDCDYKSMLIKSKKNLFESRRKFYYKLNIHKKTVREYQQFKVKIDDIIEKL